jgi:cholesterol transport system auxiliary component
MIASAEQQWFNQANIFSATVGQNTIFFPDYTLQTVVSEFYGDYRSKPEKRIP